MRTGLKNKIILSIVAGAVLYIGFTLATDAGALWASIKRLPASMLVLALALSAVNYGLRYVRWQMYLRQMAIPLSNLDGFVLFFAGLALSVTPGKAGELLKAEFIRNRTGTPLSRGIPLVMMERLTDFISLIFLCLVTIFHMREGVVPLVSAMCLISLALLALSSPSLIHKGLSILRKLPRSGRLAAFLQDAYDDSRILLAPRPLIWATALGCAAWFAECVGCFVIFEGLDLRTGLSASTFIYSSSTLFGALTMLPGGLGTTEASITGLLVYRDTPLAAAVAATLIVRACTLWFAVAVGGLTALVFSDRFRAVQEQTKNAER